MLLFSGFCAGAQESLNMTLLGHWDDDNLPVASPGNLNLQYSGCWAMAINGSEIAVLGGARHVLFFDITNPAQPELIGKFEGTSTTVWREMKSYKNRIYAVSDNTTEGLRIFDLSQAPDTRIASKLASAGLAAAAVTVAPAWVRAALACSSAGASGSHRVVSAPICAIRAAPYPVPPP